MSGPKQLAVIHESHLFQQCLAVVLGEVPNCEVVGLGHDRQEVLEFLVRERPDVAIVDLSLPDELTIEVAACVRENLLDTKMIVIVTNETQHRLADFVVAGADAWVHQESSLEELRTAVRDVLEGRTFCASRLVEHLFTQFADVVRATQWQERAKSMTLTQRELEILDLISEHLSNKQIARRLSISLYTVKNHVHSILEKLEVDSRHLAVDYARQQRWLSSTRTLNPGG